jgi:hypothetical protein
MSKNNDLDKFQHNNCDGCFYADPLLLYTGVSACTRRAGTIQDGVRCTNRTTNLEQFIRNSKN